MVNFRYGSVLAAEIQINLDESAETSEQLEQKLSKYSFKHLLYELSRSIFGPTMELIIIYEDHYRQDLKAKMYPTGRVYSLNTQSLRGI
jgi:hypothetical protein